MNLIECLCKKIHKDDAFKSSYSSLLKAHGEKKILLEPKLEGIDFNHISRCCDILSKSDNSDDLSLALDIAVMLSDLFPSFDKTKELLSSVLSSSENLLGLKAVKSPVFGESALDLMDKIMRREELRIPNGSEDEFFLRPQKQIFDRMLDEKVFCFSGPTSVGKSFVLMKFIEFNYLHSRHYNYAMVIPTKALINEVAQKIRDILAICESRYLEASGFHGEINPPVPYAVVTNPSDLAFRRKDCKFVCVMTQERMVRLLRSNPSISIDYMFIDEAHKLSSKREDRNPLYYQMSSLICKQGDDVRFSFASPFVPNPEIYAELLYGNYSPRSYTTDYSPVAQTRIFVDLNDKYFSIFNRVNHTFEKFYNFRKEYDRYDVITNIGKGHRSIVYCNSLKKVIDYACEFDRKRGRAKNNRKLLDAAAVVREEISSRCILAKLLTRGIGFHVSYLPQKIRKLIEDLFKDKDSGLDIVFCTSTLLEGVNVPADYLFITSLRNGGNNLSEVELSNLMGRAGRISHSISGNIVFISDKENNFTIEEKKWKVKTQRSGIQLFLESKDKSKKPFGQIIVDSLLDGDVGFSQIPTMSRKRAIRYSSLLLTALIEGADTPVVRHFSPYMKKEDIAVLVNKYKTKAASLEDECELCISQSQLDSLCHAIMDEGLDFPQIDNLSKKAAANKVIEFLGKLKQCFNWSYYESDDLGRGESYIHYGTILFHWLYGHNTREIIEGALIYRTQHPDSPVFFHKEMVYEFFDSTDDVCVNYVIAGVLDDLENVVQYKLSNYIQYFSFIYRRIKGVAPKYDWGEYISFGSMDEKMIYLQKIGFSRESANLILRSNESYMVRNPDGSLMILDTLANFEDEDVCNEYRIVEANNPDCIFTPPDPEWDDFDF